MPSHDIRINVEHYENGGFGVISLNHSRMGLQTIREVKEAVEDLIILELEGLNKW